MALRTRLSLFPQLDADWSIGHDIPAFHEPPPDDAGAMTIETALHEWEQASGSLQMATHDGRIYYEEASPRGWG